MSRKKRLRGDALNPDWNEAMADNTSNWQTQTPIVTAPTVSTPTQAPVKTSYNTGQNQVPAKTTTATTTYKSACVHDGSDLDLAFTIIAPKKNPTTGKKAEWHFHGSKGSSIKGMGADVILDFGGAVPSKMTFLKGDLPEEFSALAVFTSEPRFVMRFDWPDRKAPPVPFTFWPVLWKCITDTLPTGGKIICACIGGHGRTGTALCALYMAATGGSSDNAINHVKKVYCESAVESKDQEDYLDDYSVALGKVPSTRKAKPPAPAPAPTADNTTSEQKSTNASSQQYPACVDCGEKVYSKDELLCWHCRQDNKKPVVVDTGKGSTTPFIAPHDGYDY